MLIEEVLIVKHNGNLYGINTNVVEHILRVIPMTPVPMAPKSVRGLCAIEGSIVSVLDLSHLLSENTPIDENLPDARLITVHSNEMVYSILTQEVVNNITIDQNDMEYIPADNQRDDGVVAVYKYEGTILQVVELPKLIEQVQLSEFSLKGIKDRAQTFDKTSSNDGRTRRYLLFGMGDETYGLEVSKIREVINLPETFTSMSDCSAEMLGMMTLREELIVVADLRIIYSLDATKNDKNRIIVIQSNDKIMGVVVNEIVDIVDFPIDDIDHMPSNFKDDKIVGVANINEKLVSLINIAIIDSVIEKESRVETKLDKSRDDTIDDESVEIVTFTLANKNYAFKTNEVIEIIDEFVVTDVPDLPEMVEGVTNIRGKVIPIVKLHSKLELPERDKHSVKLIVCQLEGNAVGIVVDTVKNVKNVKETLFIEEEESPYFTHVIKEKKDVVLMIDLPQVLSTLKKVV